MVHAAHRAKLAAAVPLLNTQRRAYLKQYTEQEQAIIRDGVLAEEALKTPAFASAINELSEQLANAIVGTDPKDHEKRERIYYAHLGLKEVIAILNQRVALKQGIEAQVDDQENE